MHQVIIGGHRRIDHKQTIAQPTIVNHEEEIDLEVTFPIRTW